MSLTSYRAAPPRVGIGDASRKGEDGWIGRPGGDLLSRALRHSTMGAGEFHGRVRDGIGCRLPAKATRSSNPPWRWLSVYSRWLSNDWGGRFWLFVVCAASRTVVFCKLTTVIWRLLLGMISMHGVAANRRRSSLTTD